MNRALVLLIIPSLLGAAEPSYRFRKALPGYRYSFPRDHFSHPEFQTEWWYYTGNLRSSDGHRYGFELTFFRHALDRKPLTSVWDVDDVWLAHFAFSDIDGRQFRHWQRLNRTGPGLAGASQEQGRVWNGNWQVEWKDGRQQLQAVVEGLTLRLEFETRKPPVIQGVNGVSQKAAGPGRASHYISFTRLLTKGTIENGGSRIEVTGTSWMDHEFFTHQLEPNQSGWDWLSLQFDDNTELMLFRLRRKDGTIDPYSAGTFVDAQGKGTHLAASDFALTPGRKWEVYPIEWRIQVPKLGIDVNIATRLPNQELKGAGKTSPNYWEGAIEITGTRTGVGYLEMTGYRTPGQSVMPAQSEP